MRGSPLWDRSRGVASLGWALSDGVSLEIEAEQGPGREELPKRGGFLVKSKLRRPGRQHDGVPRGTEVLLVDGALFSFLFVMVLAGTPVVEARGPCHPAR